MPISENGMCGLLALKNTIGIFSVFDIILGVFYCLFLSTEVISDWEFYNINGPHYFLTALYFIRISSLTFGIIGFSSMIKLSAPLAKTYYKTKLFELAVLPALGLLSSYDMC
jgi:hypothetical protein